MKKHRVIPVLLLKNGWLVQSRSFRQYNNIGNPVTSVKRLSQWASDELIFLDITRTGKYDTQRDDQGYENRDDFLGIIRDVSKSTFMPLTVGGRIRSCNEIEDRLQSGADKVALNTALSEDPNFIKDSVKEFGSQCIVASIDVKKGTNDNYCVLTHGGMHDIKREVAEYCKYVETLGVGEILINSIDRDGAGSGYDIPLLQSVADSVSVPVIACGGVGEWEHFQEALENTNVDAVAAANIFHHTDQSVFYAKKHLTNNGMNIRPPDLLTNIK
jgi:cyclase